MDEFWRRTVLVIEAWVEDSHDVSSVHDSRSDCWKGGDCRRIEVNEGSDGVNEFMACT